jgi:hypothetical protein
VKVKLKLKLNPKPRIHCPATSSVLPLPLLQRMPALLPMLPVLSMLSALSALKAIPPCLNTKSKPMGWR